MTCRSCTVIDVTRRKLSRYTSFVVVVFSLFYFYLFFFLFPVYLFFLLESVFFFFFFFFFFFVRTAHTAKLSDSVQVRLDRVNGCKAALQPTIQ